LLKKNINVLKLKNHYFFINNFIVIIIVFFICAISMNAQMDDFDRLVWQSEKVTTELVG